MDNWWDHPVTITPPVATPPPASPAAPRNWWEAPNEKSSTNIDDLAPPEKPTEKKGSSKSLIDQGWEFMKHLVSTGPIGQAAAIPGQVYDALDGPAGALRAIQAPLQANQDLFDQAYNAYKKGDYGHAAIKGLYYLLNGTGLGTSLSKAGDQAEAGNYGAAAGTGMGLGLTLASPEVLPAVETAMATWRKPTAPNLTQFAADLQKAIPPKKGAPYTTQDAIQAAPYYASEHASSPITGVEATGDAGDSAITQIEEQVKRYIAIHPNDLIRTDPLGAARQALSQSVKEGDVESGMRELEGYGLDEPVTVDRAEAVRSRLNAENTAVMKRTSYDQALARKVDPGFTAREAALSALRNGEYDQLKERGIAGVQQLRRDEGAVIAVRNAARYHQYNGATNVPGSGFTSIPAQVARNVIPPLAASGGGYMMGGVPGALAAGGATALADRAIQAMIPANLTRDAMAAKAFNNLKMPAVQYPFVPPEPEIQGLLPSPPIVSAREPLSPSDRFIPNRTVVSPDVSGTRVYQTPWPVSGAAQRLLPEASPPPIVSVRAPVSPSDRFVPERTVVSPDTSQTTVNPGFFAPVQKRLAGAPITEPVPTEPSQQVIAGRPGFTGVAADTSGLRDISTKSYIVRDPKTGRFKRVYLPDWKE